MLLHSSSLRCPNGKTTILPTRQGPTETSKEIHSQYTSLHGFSGAVSFVHHGCRPWMLFALPCVGLLISASVRAKLQVHQPEIDRFLQYAFLFWSAVTSGRCSCQQAKHLEVQSLCNTSAECSLLTWSNVGLPQIQFPLPPESTILLA